MVLETMKNLCRDVTWYRLGCILRWDSTKEISGEETKENKILFTWVMMRNGNSTLYDKRT